MSFFDIRNLTYFDLAPLNLHVEVNECVGLTGPSGSGKTRLLRALADLDSFEGEIRLQDQPYDEFKPHEWRRRVALLPAESQWWFETVGDHFNHFNENLLHHLGFDNSVMKWDVSRLSSGEKQRLALLRMLANQPQVLLLDEPTSNLDPGFIERVEDFLTSYRAERKVAAFWVSHAMEQLKRVSTRILRIKNKQWQKVPL